VEGQKLTTSEEQVFMLFSNLASCLETCTQHHCQKV